MTRRLLLVAIVAALCGSCSTMHPASTGTGSAIGVGVRLFPVSQRSPAPALRGTTLAGQAFDLSRVTGHRIVAINVWASWCAPCRQEMPLLVAAARSGLSVVGVDERDSSSRARTFAKAHGATYPTLADPQGALLTGLASLPQTGIPSTLFLDRRGRIAARVVGPLDRASLRRIVRTLGGSS
jgi:thiol-disulfide isomerase/thioredoxin